VSGVRAALAAALVRVGGVARDRHLVLLDAGVGYVAMGRWLRRRGFRLPATVPRRTDLFDMVIDSDPRRLLYLELGVHEGDSIRHWAARVTDPDARFVGFDSFEGLPETWNEQARRGHFATGGRSPDVGDARVSFVKGWFEDTLPAFAVPPHDVLVVALDADLYSSTITALRALRPHLRAGAWLYFDELNDRHHELRALDEFLDTSGARIVPWAAARNLRHWLFRVVAA
jgi:hypothetical protein